MIYEYPLVVFSHLRWDFVFQRPQQLMTRLAAGRRVYFIEEPISGPGTPHWQHAVDPSGVVILRPVLPGPVHGWDSSHSGDLLLLLSMFVRKEQITSPVVWLYTPMAISS